jgi:hypothetical protein
MDLVATFLETSELICTTFAILTPMNKTQFVNVPILSGRELQRMLKVCGFTGRAFDRFINRSLDYSSKRLFNLRELPLNVSEALYLLAGHDMFWTAYNHPKVRKQPPHPTDAA